MIKCVVIRNAKTNQIEKVLAENGEESNLYAKFLKDGNPELSLKRYALALHYKNSDLFKHMIELDQNGDPTFDSFMKAYDSEDNMLDDQFLYSLEEDLQQDKDSGLSVEEIFLKDNNDFELVTQDVMDAPGRSDRYIKKMRNISLRLANIRIKLIGDIDNETDSNIKQVKTSVLNKVEDLRRLFNEGGAELDAFTVGKLAEVKDIVKIGKSQLLEVSKYINRAGETLDVEDIEIILDIVGFWNAAANFQGGFNPILNTEEAKAKELMEGDIKELAHLSDILYSEISKKTVERYVERINNGDFVKGKITEADIRKPVKDIFYLTEELRNPIEFNDKLAQMSAVITERMHTETAASVETKYKELAEFLKNANASETGGEPYQQVTKEGNQTGNLVDRYTVEFYDEIDKVDKKQKRDDFLEKRKQLKDISHVLRVDALEVILTNDEGSDEYNEALPIWEKSREIFIEEYGEAEFQEIEESITRDIKNHRERFYAALRGFVQDESDAVKLANRLGDDVPEAKDIEDKKKIKQIMNDYRYQSPGSFTRYLFSDLPRNKEYINPPNTFRLIIPKDDQYRDEKYTSLNDEQKALLKHMKKITKNAADAAPYVRQSKNFFPNISRQMIETMNLGTQFTFNVTKLMDQFQNIIRATRTDISSLEYDELRLPMPRVEAKKMAVTEKMIDEEMQLERARLLANDQDIPSDEVLRQIVVDKLSKAKSWDLGAVMGYYIFHTELFKSRAKFETLQRLNYRLALEREGLITDNFGDSKDADGDDVTGGKASRLLVAMQTASLRDFYGMNLRDEIKKLNSKALTSEEKKERDNLEKTLSEIEDKIEEQKEKIKKTKNEGINEDGFRLKKQDGGKLNKENEELWKLLGAKSILEEKIENLGEYKTVAGLTRGIIYYNQLRGMGWNVFSGISTLLYGSISNSVQAGRFYSTESLEKANSIIHHLRRLKSSGENLTEGTKSYDLAKAVSLNRIFSFIDTPIDIQGQLSETKPQLKKKLSDKLGPMAFQEFAEFQTQMPVIVAVLMDEKVTVKIGGEEKEISYWEGFDHNGAWKYDADSFNSFFKIKSKAKDTIRRIHGNYDTTSSFKAQQSAVWTALLQFRRWSIAAFTDRFAGEQDALFHGGKIKGRYRSYASLLNVVLGKDDVKGAPGILGSLAKQVAVSYIAALPFVKRSSLNIGDIKNGVVDLSSFQSNEFSEVDIKNMISNMHEIAFLLMLMTIAGIVSLGLDDDDEGIQQAALNFTYNQLLRAERDITMWVNPMAFEKTFATSVPAMSIVNTVMNKIPTALYKTVWEGEGTIQTGLYSGDNRLFRAVSGALPGLSQGQNFIDNMEGITQRGR